VLKCPTVYERLGGLAASARAVLRRSAVYGALVPAGDPGLLESGGACTICQARPPGPGGRRRCALLYTGAGTPSGRALSARLAPNKAVRTKSGFASVLSELLAGSAHIYGCPCRRRAAIETSRI